MVDIPDWMIPRTHEGVRLRNLAMVSDCARGMTQAELAKKYFITRGRVHQIIGKVCPRRKQGRITRVYAAMRREQLEMLNDYPKIFAEIMAQVNA